MEQTNLTTFQQGQQATPAATTETPTYPTADAAADQIRENLLRVDAGQPVTIAGDTYHVARLKTDAVHVTAGNPTVEFTDGGTLAVGPADRGVVWTSDIPDRGRVSTADVIDYQHVIVRDRPPLPDLGGEVDVAMTNERECPECERRGLFFEEDNVTAARGRVEAVPEQVVELRVCPTCDRPVVVHRTPSRASTATVRTRSVAGESGEAELAGLYVRSDTDVGAARRQSWAYRGLWTAEEVAELVNGRLSGETWGFASVEGDGERVIWNDDQPFSMEVSFSRVEGGTSRVEKPVAVGL